MQQPRRFHLSMLVAGLIGGAGLGISGLFPGLGWPGLILGCMVLLFLCGYRGYRASASTGQVDSGVLVGVLIGLASSGVSIVIVVVSALATSDGLKHINRDMFINAFNIDPAWLTGFFYLELGVELVGLAVVVCLVGLGGGALGGAIGKGRFVAPAFPPQYQGARSLPLPPYPPQGYAPSPENVPRGYIPPQGPPTPLPPSLLTHRQRQRSPAGVGLLILLTLMLLGGGSVGIYGAVTGKWPWHASGWHAQASGIAQDLRGVTWSGSQFVAVGSGGYPISSITILTSPDGRTWTAQDSGTSQDSQTLEGVAWSGSQFVAVGGNPSAGGYPPAGIILTSPDGRTWTTRYSGGSQNLNGVAWSGSQFVVVGWNGYPIGSNTILTSPDGRTWTAQDSGIPQNLRGVTWSGSQFVAVGSNGTILTSPDGRTWTAQDSGTSQDLFGVAWSGSQFVVVGNGGTVLTSPDGRAWTTRYSGGSQTPQTLEGVAWSGSQFVAVGSGGDPTNGIILTSPNGHTWSVQDSGTSEVLFGIAWSGSQFVVVGDGGTILTSP